MDGNVSIADQPAKSKETLDEPTKQNSGKELPRSPFAGCLIGMIVLFVIGSLLFITIWNFFRLNTEINHFTEDQPWEIPIHTADQSARKKIQSKLADNQKVLDEGRGGELTFTASELNTIIHTYDKLIAYRGTLWIDSITAENMQIRIAFPMNESPLSDAQRYLNGIMTARPEMTETEVEEERNSDRELILRIDEIKTANGSTVPDGFLGHFSPLRITENFLNKEEARPFLRAIKEVKLGEGSVILTMEPSSDPEITTNDLKPYRNRFFLIFGIVAMGVISAIVLGLIFQKKRENSRSSE